MAADERKLELIKKLQALAERGVGGEKETAQRKLAQLIAKYKFSEEDLMEDTLEDHDFKFSNEFESKILNQVMYKVAKDRRKYAYRAGRGSKTTYGITCTKAEAVQIRIEYEFYKELWKEEVDFFLFAFIQKHRIFNISPDAPAQKISRDEARRMAAMIEGMQDKAMQPLIEESKTGT